MFVLRFFVSYGTDEAGWYMLYVNYSIEGRRETLTLTMQLEITPGLHTIITLHCLSPPAMRAAVSCVARLLT